MLVYSAFAVVASLGGLVPAVLASPVLNLDAAQRPLSSADLGSGPPYTLREQNDQVCDAGSRQWTGWINVSEEKRLFYWFFESRSAPLDDPVVVWLNGGPGGPPMMGLFSEIGPCLTVKGGNGTIRNEHSWSNFVNVLFIDQPAGVGFFSMNGGTEGGPDNLAEASEDFDRFLSIFFTDVFPQYSHLPFHLAGESFGGVYVPFFVKHIAQRQHPGVPGVFQTPIASIVLVNAVVGMTSSSYVSVYDHMCKFDGHGRNKLKLGFNATTCRAVEEAVPRCAALGRQCVATYNLDVCRAADAFCDEHIGRHLDVRVGGRVPYDDRVICENGTLPPVRRGLAALGLEEGWNFTSVNMDLNMRWEARGDSFTPSTREMRYILDETDTKVLVINGNNDISVTTEGNKRVYDDLPGRTKPRSVWKSTSTGRGPTSPGSPIRGGEFKAADKLAFATFDDAGHEAVGHQKEAGTFLVKCWLSTARDGPCAFLDRRTETIRPSPAQDVEL
ncbi:hypothetical protein PG993_000946 [Apiospora rasikravindrae]|uniref:Uncharacterized protein n=1 Tax=Apiospora rasikravindrae TaxID=990691 RepID=A0ABR1UA05_9PEZI